MDAAVWAGTALSVAAVSLTSLVGAVTLTGGKKWLPGLTTYLVSLAVGALLGGSFLHLIPSGLHAFGPESERVWLLVLAGLVASFVLEKTVASHTHGHDQHDTHEARLRRRRSETKRARLSVVTLVLTGDAIHNFIDGILIAGAWLVSPAVGVVTTAIVLLHEVPQELGDFGVLISNGLSVRQALMCNFLTASTAFAGAFASLLIGGRLEAFASYLVLLAAGNFIYIAAADLVPQLHERRGALISTLPT